MAVPVVLSACGSDHHVSPWGGAEAPPLAAFAGGSDLDAQTALVDEETAALGLSKKSEIRLTLPHGVGPALIRGYEGTDAVGRRTHAVRVATGRGVVMALGPLDPRDPARDQATELVPALVPGEQGGAEGGAYRSGTDLNGDGSPDVVVKNDRGALEIWHIGPLGADRYPVDLEASPTRALDVDGDGFIDLAGEVTLDPADPIAPHFTDVATFDGARYSDRTPAARDFHARLATPPPTLSPAASAKARLTAPPPRDEERLSGALERAWHAILSGEPKADVQKDLEREPVPAALRASFDRHARRIDALRAR